MSKEQTFQEKLNQIKNMKENLAQEANKEISNRLDEIRRLLSECEQISSTCDVEFSFDGPSGSYGMGGYFSGGEWNSSSQNC